MTRQGGLNNKVCDFLRSENVRLTKSIHLHEPTTQAIKQILELLRPHSLRSFTWSYKGAPANRYTQFEIEDFFTLCQKQSGLETLMVPPFRLQKQTIDLAKAFQAAPDYSMPELKHLEIHFHHHAHQTIGPIAGTILSVSLLQGMQTESDCNSELVRSSKRWRYAHVVHCKI